MRREHTMETFARFLQDDRQFLEPDSGVDEIAQHSLPRLGLPAQVGVDGFGEEGFPKFV